MNTKNGGYIQLAGEVMADLWGRHRGKMAGLIVGLLFGVLVLTLGFWRSLFISLCMVLGFVVGKWIDEQGDWRLLYQRIFKER